jgi:hypothetical protein
MQTYFPQSVQESANIVSRAGQKAQVLIPCGRQGLLGKHAYSFPRQSAFLSARDLDGIVEYVRNNLSIKVQAGVRLGKLQDAVSEDGLFLPLTDPGYQTRTIGSLIVEGAMGQEGLRFGSLLDAILGLEFVSPTGKVVHTGGQTVKNVSGYDFTRLFTRSWGSLGLITSATFRLQPCLEDVVLLRAKVSDLRIGMDLAARVLASHMSVLNVRLTGQREEEGLSCILDVRMGGFSETVQEHVHRMKTEILASAEHIEQARDAKAELPAFQEGSGYRHICGRGRLKAIASLAPELESLGAKGRILGLDIDCARREIRIALSAANSEEEEAEDRNLLGKDGIQFDIEPVQPDRIFSVIKAAIDPYGVFPSFEVMRPRHSGQASAFELERTLI